MNILANKSRKKRILTELFPGVSKRGEMNQLRVKQCQKDPFYLEIQGEN